MFQKCLIYFCDPVSYKNNFDLFCATPNFINELYHNYFDFHKNRVSEVENFFQLYYFAQDWTIFTNKIHLKLYL